MKSTAKGFHKKQYGTIRYSSKNLLHVHYNAFTRSGSPPPGPAWRHCIGPPSKLLVSSSMCCLKGDMPKWIHSLMDTWHWGVLTILEYIYHIYNFIIDIYIYWIDHIYYTSSTAQGGGGSFKNRKRIGEIDCCEWRMSEQKHWPTD